MRAPMKRLSRACPELADRLRDTGCCIVFDGRRDPGGYGRLYEPGVGNTQAHRYVYKRLHGQDLGSLTVDHLCYVRPCLNPDHLEAVPQKENLRRARDRRNRLVGLDNAASLACCEAVAGPGAPKRDKPVTSGPSRRQQAEDRRVREVARWQPATLPVSNVFDALGLPQYVTIPNPPGTKPPNRVIDLSRISRDDLPLLACAGVREQIRSVLVLE